MSVIINDFEIIPEPRDDKTADEETTAPEPSAIRPIDIAEIVDREERRQRRLRAH